jgi:stearoyl-CoA desaturase (delta-9 desaturase)
LGILIGGEELHNNHHTYATSAKLSNKWYEVDMGWMYIRLLASLRLATIKKLAPVPRLADRKSVLDIDTLQAVLANRYEVMARYGTAMQQAYRQELSRLKASGSKERYRMLRTARTWFHREEAVLDDRQRERLPELLSESQKLRTCMELRKDLSAMWERSNASREQLVTQMQDWCHRAEQSGIQALRDFAGRLRRYA